MALIRGLEQSETLAPEVHARRSKGNRAAPFPPLLHRSAGTQQV